MPSAGDGGGTTVIVTLHAEGTQIYECKPDRSKAHVLTWQFREPIATLMIGGQSDAACALILVAVCSPAHTEHGVCAPCLATLKKGRPKAPVVVAVT